MIIILGLFLFVSSFLLTWAVRWYSLQKSILDIPNDRSSHQVPTPRGGGLAIATLFFGALIFLFAKGLVDASLTKALIGGGAVIAATGYWDDLKSIPPLLRAGLHFCAAFWVLYCLGGFSFLDLGSFHFHIGWMGIIVAAVGIVWMINLYNFMDGIDGIAASEAIFVSLVAGITLYALGAQSLAWICFLLVALVSGFLLWNWSPAKIFLGDIGSGLLGFIFAVLALASANHHYIPLLPWFSLLAIFILDATFTLVHRLLRKERWYCAHREHIYQRLVQKGMSHKAVTLLIIFVNFCFLMPLFFFMLISPKISTWLFLLIVFCFAVVWKIIVQKGKTLSISIPNKSQLT